VQDMASTDIEQEESLGALLYLLFGGEFLGIALWVIGNNVSGLLTTLCYALGSAALVLQFRSRWAVIGAFVFSLVALAAVAAVTILIAYLASNGAYGTDRSTGPYAVAENVIIAVILWFLLGVPRRAFIMRLDPHGHGHARGFVIRVCTVVVSGLTGTYVLLLHYGGGPLSDVQINALAVGTVFTVALVAPAYRFVATRCWELGLRRMFLLSPRGRMERGAAMKEIFVALTEFASRQSVALRPGHETTMQTEVGRRQSIPDTESGGLAPSPPVIGQPARRKRKARSRKGPGSDLGVRDRSSVDAATSPAREIVRGYIMQEQRRRRSEQRSGND
jgi:hypothetical protein